MSTFHFRHPDQPSAIRRSKLAPAPHTKNRTDESSAGRVHSVVIRVRTPWANTVTAEIIDGAVRVILPAEHRRLVQLLEAWIANLLSAGLVLKSFMNRQIGHSVSDL